MSMDISARGLARQTALNLASNVSGQGSALVGFRAAASASARTVQDKLRDTVSLKDFGAVGDGVTDDTAAVQAWATYCATNHANGYAPAGNYKLAAEIVVPQQYGFGLRGAGRWITTFTQSTNNVAVFNLGGSGSANCHSLDFGGFTLTYTNVQAAANTAALPIKISAMWYESRFTDICFQRGYYAMSVASGVLCPWGNTWDDLVFAGELSGGVYDNVLSGSAGTPNNNWGRILIDAAGMTKVLFDNFRCYNSQMDAVEILNLSRPIMHFASSSRLRIGAIKIEQFDLSGVTTWAGLSSSGNAGLFYGAQSVLDIGHLDIAGATCKLNPAVAGYVFTGDFQRLRVDYARVGPTQAVSNCFFFGTAAAARCSLGSHNRTSTGFAIPWQDNGGSDTSRGFQIDQDNNTLISQDKGNADYTMAMGDPCFVQFETALSAARSVNLPNTSDDLFDGYRVRVESKGAVNGANTLAVKQGGSTLATLTADNTWVELMWRRNTGNLWRVVARGHASIDTGWTTGTGTAQKGAFAAYAGATHTGAYVQATIQALDDAAKNASQRVLALEAACRAAGIIT